MFLIVSFQICCLISGELLSFMLLYYGINEKLLIRSEYVTANITDI